MIKCSDCGRFVSYKSIDEKQTQVYFEPSSHFGPEVIEHTHSECNKRQQSAKY